MLHRPSASHGFSGATHLHAHAAAVYRPIKPMTCRTATCIYSFLSINHWMRSTPLAKACVPPLPPSPTGVQPRAPVHAPQRPGLRGPPQVRWEPILSTAAGHRHPAAAGGAGPGGGGGPRVGARRVGAGHAAPEARGGQPAGGSYSRPVSAAVWGCGAAKLWALGVLRLRREVASTAGGSEHSPVTT